MTRLAIITDVHADLHALQDALVQIERLGCERVVCAGDLVDYGLFPDETIRLMRKRGIPTILGNHDAWAVGKGAAGDPYRRVSEDAYDGGRAELSEASRRFLAELPREWRGYIDGVRVHVCHGTPHSYMDGIFPNQTPATTIQSWLDDLPADILVCGHTHLAFEVVVTGNRRVVNPGALLRDSAEPAADAMVYDPATGTFGPAEKRYLGTFGVLELPARKFTVHRARDGVEVDIPRVVRG